MDTIIYGGDTETYFGRPMTLQFYSQMAGVNELIFVNERNATEKFFRWCGTLARKMFHVMFVHNLPFDLPEFLWDVKDALVEQTGGEFSFSYGDWKIHGVYGSPTFCYITHPKKKIQILIVDSMLWYQGALAKAAEIFCPDLPKLKQPKDLGTKRFTARDTDFCAYAMRDAEVAYFIGCAVQRIHQEFNIRQAVSLADMSAKIFRHHFLRYTIPQPQTDVIRAALHSYHGGKNNVYPGAAPAWHIDVSALDISSAYPYAMSELPAFSNQRAYKRMGKKIRGLPKQVPPLGIYQISGRAADCAWPCLFTHGFKPIAGEKFSNLWVHGYELNEGLATGEVKLSSIRGYYYDEDMDQREPAFRAFVDHFYRLKETQTDKAMRHMYKIILNALYGKFIQTRKSNRVIYTDIDSGETVETSTMVAGGMFHPFIASTITAHTRAYIHQIEHAHEAIHTATDGIYTYMGRAKRLEGRPRSGLGSLQVEGRGDLLLFRNKCYILYGDKPTDPANPRPSAYFRGKFRLKEAKHGFQGTINDLERLAAHNKRKYRASRPHRLREAVKRGLEVNRFEEREYVLKVGPIGIADRRELGLRKR